MTAYRAETQGGLAHALQAAGREANQLLLDDATAVIEVKPECRTRTQIQNSKIHAMISDIAKQVKLNGNEYSAHVWKRLTTAEFLKDRGERPMIIQDLSGEILVLWEKTSGMTTKVMADYIEWLYAFGANEGVVWKDGKAEEV